jgi:glycosyltransferase involved in cell wall biosynthesis
MSGPASSAPRVTFGIIVLNGEPFTRYCLRSIYPFAHQIIAVEGASRHAAAIATADGHSTDGTLETLRRFQAEEDPGHKLEVVTRDGFWEEKDEQSRAYAQRATGDWLWQVDIDEFYRPEDMSRCLDLLRREPEVAGAAFAQISFWGGIDYWSDSPFLRAFEVRRVFRFGPGYRYAAHRPPTVLDPAGRDLTGLKWLGARETARRGMRLHHYSLVFPKQVREKSAYYQDAMPAEYPEMLRWAEDSFFHLRNPFRVHNVYQVRSWLERFRGEHPPEILSMMADLRSGKIRAELRPTDDIEALLGSPGYRLGRALLKARAGFAQSGPGRILGGLRRRLRGSRG